MEQWATSDPFLSVSELILSNLAYHLFYNEDGHVSAGLRLYTRLYYHVVDDEDDDRRDGEEVPLHCVFEVSRGLPGHAQVHDASDSSGFFLDLGCFPSFRDVLLPNSSTRRYFPFKRPKLRGLAFNLGVVKFARSLSVR